MFASEKVMLEYFDQLLSDEEENDINTVANTHRGSLTAEKQSRPAILSDDIMATPLAREKPQVSHKTPAAKPFKEPEVELPAPQKSTVAKLLEQVNLKQDAKIAKERQKTVDLVRSVSQDIAPPSVETKQEIALQPPIKVEKEVIESFPDEPFQALFFSVAGLSLAVPLKELGGIHNLTELSTLFGKPAWFKGVMLNRDKKLNVVDSARWVMPEKYNQAMEESLNYRYLIMLGESNWGLAAESLVETESITPDAVKWRKNAHKRPWLMGTIKEKMCALLHVSDLIAMLEQGIDARQV